MTIHLITTFVLPMIVVIALTPLVIRFAAYVGAVDLPNERKVHLRPIPRLGGVAVFAGFFLSLMVLSLAGIIQPGSLPLASYQGLSLITAMVIVFFTGAADDLRSLDPGKKFLVQVLAASIVYAGGFRISFVTSFLTPELYDLGLLDFPVTILWIVGVTNAFNLIDGLDGLASGVGIIAAFSIFSISYMKDDIPTALVMLAFAGAVTGFLRYNFNPAVIFLGDSGSLLIGFTLAVLSIHASTKGSTAFAVAVPMLALGLPIMETLLSMIRRLLFSFLPEQRNGSGILTKLHVIFLPDRKHIHHQLIAMGLSHRNVVLVLYMVSIVFAAGAFAVTVFNNAIASVVIAAVGLAMVTGIRQLHYKEMAILSNGILLPLYEWPVIRQSLFQGFVDLGFSVASFMTAYFMTCGDHLPARTSEFIPIVSAVGGVQLGAFAVCGLYNSSFRYAGIGEVLRIAKAGLLSVAAAGIVILVLWEPWMQIQPITLVTDFYLLVTLIAGSRMSFNILNFLFERKNTSGRGVLIYGARANGILTLQYILHHRSLGFHPIGFLDDDPSLEGKNISGYTVFGGHWMLPRILRKHPFDEILIASESMKPEIMSRIQSFADEFKIRVHIRKFFMEEVQPAARPKNRKHVHVVLNDESLEPNTETLHR